MRQKLFPPRLPLFALLALIAVAGHAQQQPAEPGPGIDRQVGRWVEPCLRLRSGASVDRSILECLEPGTPLRIVGGISGWSQVRLLDGTEGWVDSGYLEAAPAASSPGPPPAAPVAQTAGPPAAPTPTTSDLSGQIAALEGQLEAMSALRAATEERLRKTVAAAEQAQIEAGRLGQRVRELEGQRDAAAGERAEGLAAELEAGKARTAELEQALAAAEAQLLRAAQLNAEQERRIEALDAELARARGGEAELRQNEAELRQAVAAAEAKLRQSEAELRQAVAAAEARAQAAEDGRQSREQRVAELEAALPAARQREAELARAVEDLESRLRAAEQSSALQAQRVEELARQLAAAETRLAAAAPPTPPAARPEPAPKPAPEPAPEPPPAAVVQVREPIVADPRPSTVQVREPLAIEETAEPEPAAPTPAEAPPSPTEAAMDTVRAWAAAWSDQRVEDYLAFYAAGFRPADGLSRAAWERQRAERLARPSYIRVTISSLSAEPAPDGTVRATFRQDYESNTFADTVTKVLSLAEQNGDWRILAERAEP